VNHSASAFNPEKLLWINHEHIKAMPADELGHRLMPFLIRVGLEPADGPDPEAIADAYRERADTLVHMAASARYCFEDFDEIEPNSVKKHLRPVILEPMRTLRIRLEGLEHWGGSAILEAIQDVADDYELNMGKLGQPLRVAVTGGPVSPPLDITLTLVGRERTLERLDSAISLIEERAGVTG
jgi:glutamyl-tRNA synthetase